MLSNPLHRFAPYHAMPSPTLLSGGHVTASHLHAAGLDTMGPGSHYALQQLQQHVSVHNHHLARAGPQPKHRQHPYGPVTRATGAAGPIRRRISRACDQCNQLRTKCDGQHPCAHCIEFGLGCEYIRERKKRGKASRKDLAAQAAAAAAAQLNGHKNPSQAGENDQSPPNRTESTTATKRASSLPIEHQTTSNDKTMSDMSEGSVRSQRTGSMDSIDLGAHQTHIASHPGAMDRDLESPAALDLSYGNVHQEYHRQGMGAHLMNGASHHTPYGSNQAAMSNYPDLPYALHTQSPTGYSANTSSGFRIGASPLSAYPMAGGSTSPGWMNLASPPPQFAQHIPQPTYSHAQLRYPVLEPLLPHLGNLMPVSLACDLIDLYFASSSSAQMHPMSPYVLGFVFRKRSFLHPTKPRQCQPALLASMLWVAAQTSDAPFLTSVPSARGKICQKLLELTVSLLKPLIHTPSEEPSPVSSPIVDGVALGGLGVALPGSISMDALTGETGAFGAAGTLDDVVTYIHLATVVSASEYKGASLRWWNAAWSLARELKLGREIPQNSPSMQNSGSELDGEMGNIPGMITEEEREERRRIWWLVYIVDRHLALCYNRPLFLLDIECDGLLQPMDDTDYQNGNFYAYTDPNVLASDPNTPAARHRGPSFVCTGHSIFGYFLPLMTILGEIVDLHHARNHPRFGVGFRSSREWDDQTAEITRHLEIYEESIKRFEHRNLSLSAQAQAADEKAAEAAGVPTANDVPHDAGTPSVQSVHSVHTTSSRMTESDIQTRIVMAYGTHVMHVLHILLTGKWDPINLLDDNDLWISSQGFITATGHAVSAAEAISNILEYDPGLEFMPFFFGIYLLQGSFLLLLIADKLQVEASPSVVKACETIIRAHEACVVTLNTEYQRNFSRVMRSALAQVRGRVPEDLGEQHQRRRELLALYRWTGDGTGLAL
ncbi:transcriptional activator xlnR [Neurospora crassa]|uniref:Transcriptional activator xlnR n=1 Tax=Neurospora crassa (strain ATCC 24698 / 74-OR23-1A / CBS 708.71 / DSM 1257 / FGSC 987) TaxID=367110 RepID=Q7SAH8_NEUCR|nr:transcriptional activator xlnR [Neurospora crassa OR74A]EAA33375.1 transcriptional activator xlnR [Neurospora crassa OR74A]KHE81270.1 transcriptional activator xlnR [Neurospora crassa]|eukprot:XP_962611.1 transcriptional activator xlnR [Neurospora crassa OR74A]